MSGGAGTNVTTIALGFIVFMLVLMDVHGFSAASAIFAIPAVIFTGLLLFLSHLLGLLTGFFVGALFAGPIGLILLGVALFWLAKSVSGINAQNYMVFAIFIVLMLLLV